MIKEILLSTINAIVVAIISNYFITKAIYKHQKKNSILEEQYIKIFAPIHKILHFNKPQDYKFTYIDISEIISVNYSILPENTRNNFNEMNESSMDENFDKFKTHINMCFEFISSELSYTKNHLSCSERRKAKKELNHKSNDLVITRYAIILALLLVILFTLIIASITIHFNVSLTPIVLLLIVIGAEVLMIITVTIFSFIFDRFLANKQ